MRVRLQSQTSPASTSSARPASFNSLSIHNAPNLGVTACCREVFWTANNSPLCFAHGAAAASTPAHPLNPLSTLSHATPASAAACAVEETRRKTFTTTFDGLQKIARNEGVPALWRGLSPTLVMAIPGNVIYFTGYDALRADPRSPVRRHVPDRYAPLVAGSAARVAAAVVVSPIEMFRTRMQAAAGGRAGVFRDTLARLGELARAQGYASLWRGLSLTLWRDVPFSGFYWWGYETFRHALARARRGSVDPAWAPGRPSALSGADHAATFVDSFAAGAASGAVASLVTTPFDVGKTRQQVFVHAKDLNAGGASSTLAEKAKHAAARGELMPEDRSMPRFLYHILRTEGLPGLFRGWVARCLKVAPACAIMISSYEIGKKMAQNANERSEREAEL